MTSWHGRVEFLNELVQQELLAPPEDMQARYLRIAELIESASPMLVREPHVKSLGEGLCEIRLRGRDGIARAIYVIARPQRVVIVLVFVKKSQKTPENIIKLAKKRAKEVQDL